MRTTKRTVWFVVVGLLVCAALFVTLRAGDNSPSASASNQAGSLAAVPAGPDSSVPPASLQVQLAYTDTAALLAAQIPLFPEVFMVDLPIVMK